MQPFITREEIKWNTIIANKYSDINLELVKNIFYLKQSTKTIGYTPFDLVQWNTNNKGENYYLI